MLYSRRDKIRKMQRHTAHRDFCSWSYRSQHLMHACIRILPHCEQLQTSQVCGKPWSLDIPVSRKGSNALTLAHHRALIQEHHWALHTQQCMWVRTCPLCPPAKYVVFLLFNKQNKSTTACTHYYANWIGSQCKSHRPVFRLIQTLDLGKTWNLHTNSQ